MSNIQRIAQDINQQYYSQFELHFSTPLPRALMEELAESTRNNADRVKRVIDEYMSFECIESRLFTVPQADDKLGNLLKMLMSSQSSEEQVEAALERQAAGLLSVCVAVGGEAPLVVSMRGGAAETVAGKLEKRLRDLMASVKTNSLGPSLLHDDLGLQRPCTNSVNSVLTSNVVVMILDRSADICTPLKHSATYAGLVQDVFKMSHNRCVIPAGPDQPELVFSIDPRDPLWTTNADSPFPEAADAVDASVRQYKTEYDNAVSSNGNDPAGLRNAIQVLPELTERKRIIDLHLAMCQALLTSIKERQLGDLFAMEQRLDRSAVLDFINTANNNEEDKCRLYLMFAMGKCHGEEQLVQWDRDCHRFLSNLQPETSKRLSAAKEYVRVHRAAASLPSSPLHEPTPNDDSWSRLGRVSGGLLSGLATGVKALMSDAQHDLPLAKTARSIIDHLTQPATTGTTTSQVNYRVFDPVQGTRSSGRSVYNHVIVFVVGGVCRAEYPALLSGLAGQMMVTVGGSEVISGGDIINSFQ